MLSTRCEAVANSIKALFPQSTQHWLEIIEIALNLKLSEVWFPDHLKLHLLKSNRDILLQRINFPQLEKRKGAVLVLLSPTESGDGFQDMCISLTQRTPSVRTHKNEISFPGGHVESSDVSEMTAAQRETQEEIGITPEEYTMLGKLTPIPSNLTKMMAVPFVALSHHTLTPTEISTNEVASMHYLHLSNLIMYSAFTHCRLIKYVSSRSEEPAYFPAFFASDEAQFPSPFVTPSPNVLRTDNDGSYDPLLPEHFPGRLVWGLTGFMLSELIARIATTLALQHPTIPEMSATQLLRCTNIIARDPERPLPEQTCVPSKLTR